MYELTVSDRQLMMIRTALESYFRTRMGQFFDFADDLAFDGFDDEDHDWSDLTKRVERRDAAIEALCDVYHAVHPDVRWLGTETDIAIDIWSVIRHELWTEKPEEERRRWCVDACPPLIRSREPVVKIRRVDDAGN